MANLEIMLMLELECLLEVGSNYWQPDLFVNEGMEHCHSMEKSQCSMLKFHALTFLSWI